jgi:hypothetical protein
MPIFCLRILLGLLNLHRIGNAHKHLKYHVVKF